MGKKKKFTKLLSIQIGLASPKKIKNWAERVLPNGKKVGQVTNSQTVNYKTLRPERDGLFCERIFGPLKDYECSCGRKPMNAQEKYCPDCEIEYTTSNVRRYRLGYIKLVSPVTHIWYLKGIPSYLSLFLNMKRKEIEAIVYCTENISVSSLSTAQKHLIEFNSKFSDRLTENIETKSIFNSFSVKNRASGSSTLYRKFTWEYQDDWNIFKFFISAPAYAVDEPIPFYNNQAKQSVHNLYIDRALTGAEAIKNLLSSIDLSLLDQQLSSEIYEMSEEIDELDLQRFLYTWEERRLGFLLKARKKKIRRLKLVRQFRRTETRPEWMILSVLPVLPPDLRPILQMDNDQVAVSDLNKLYQKVLFRNNRMERHLAENFAFPKADELRYAQRLLQESVDSLIENGKGGSMPITAANDRPLKSLSDLLKGKKGRFRQNLLGKRVDYSGRSVIVVGPSLKLHQCGLPREMAIELFQPFLIRSLLATKTVRTILGAKHLIQKRNPIIWSSLYQILKNHPVLLNRAPTLHRLGFQAFQPKLVPGRAILLHPLVCPAFNADFDGDQMAVHVPLSYEARAESWKLIWSRNNILSPATGEPILLPSQDMVLGCYYLTTFAYKKQKSKQFALANTVKTPIIDTKVNELSMIYPNMESILQKYRAGLLNPHDFVWVKMDSYFENDTNETGPLEIRVNKNGKLTYLFTNFLETYSTNKKRTNSWIRTTVGRILFNEVISLN
jgi:DNA-directed RNA polymerase subunit beta'